MNSAPPTRLAVVLSHPTQYYSPWFRWLAEKEHMPLRVFYLWDFGIRAQKDPQFGVSLQWDIDLLSGYESEFVPNRARRPGTNHFFGLRNPALPSRLAAWHPDAVLFFGYKWASHLRALLWARNRRLPLVFRGDSHFLGRPAPAGWRRALLRWVYRQFAAVTYVGAANREYFETLGVPASRLFFAPHAVDQRRFDPADPAERARAAALRRDLGIAPETTVVLFAGKLVPAKQPRELLQAFIRVGPERAALVFVGEGEERPHLEALAARARPGSVHFLPFANQSEMPSRYLASDLFALPSRGLYETWGLAVNEAMHLGRPCLVSDRVGCQRDLVTDGETGWVFPAAQPESLASTLARALADQADPARREAMRRQVSERIASYTYVQASAGLRAALASLKSAS